MDVKIRSRSRARRNMKAWLCSAVYTDVARIKKTFQSNEISVILRRKYY